MNPIHLKQCEAQLLGVGDADAFSVDYQSLRIEPGTSLETYFYRLFHTTIHQCEVCGVNVREFLRYAEEQGIDTSGATVLWITNPSKSGDGLVARAARGVRELHWSFHVAIFYHGQVMDLDFTNRPTLVSAREYFERMFASDPDVMVELVPARDYVRLYLSGEQTPPDSFRRLKFADWVTGL